MCLFQVWFPQDICLGVGLLGPMVVLFLVFKGISILSSTVAGSVYIPTNSLPFSPHPLLPSPHVHKSILYVCFSIVEILQYHFSRFHIYVLQFGVYLSHGNTKDPKVVLRKQS